MLRFGGVKHKNCTLQCHETNAYQTYHTLLYIICWEIHCAKARLRCSEQFFGSLFFTANQYRYSRASTRKR